MKQIKKLFGIFAMAGIFIAAAFSTGCSDDSEDYYADDEYTLVEELATRAENTRKNYLINTSVMCFPPNGDVYPFRYVDVEAKVFVEKNSNGGYIRGGNFIHIQDSDYVAANLYWLNSNTVTIEIAYLNDSFGGFKDIVVPNNLGL